MSLQLLKALNGNKNGNFKAFIDKYENKSEPRICWYPSSGEDFRGLMFLDPKFGTVKKIEKLKEPDPPNIFLYTDYFPWDNSRFLDSKTIFSDGRTFIRINTLEELPRLNTPLHEQILDFPKGSVATNKVIFMELLIHSDKLGDITYPLIYAFVENESFCAEVLIPNKAIISHIIHVRHGGCCSGSKASGIWILNILSVIKCEVFISDGHYFSGEGDEYAMQMYPKLANNVRSYSLKKYREINNWSGLRVEWNLVIYPKKRTLGNPNVSPKPKGLKLL